MFHLKETFQIPWPSESRVSHTLAPPSTPPRPPRHVPVAQGALIGLFPCPSLRFGFVQDKYSASAFNFPAETKPQYIHVTGEALQAQRGRGGVWGGRGRTGSPRVGAGGWPGHPPSLHPGAVTWPLSPQARCSCSCPTPSASSRGSHGGAATPPAPPARACSARRGWATAGPTTPC